MTHFQYFKIQKKRIIKSHIGYGMTAREATKFIANSKAYKDLFKGKKECDLLDKEYSIYEDED